MTHRQPLVIALVALFGVAPLMAQGTEPVREKAIAKELLGRIGNARAVDNSPIATTKQDENGFSFEFRQQNASMVLNAIAEAGNVGLAMGSLPFGMMISTKSMKPLKTRDEFVAALRDIAAANNLLLDGTPSMLVVSVNPGPSLQDLRNAQAQAAAQSLHVMQLNASKANIMAPILTSLFQNQVRTPAAGQQGLAALMGAAAGVAEMAAMRAKMSAEVIKSDVIHVESRVGGAGGVYLDQSYTVKKTGGGN